jgi:hypothetical protein
MIATKGDAGHASPPPERAASLKQRGEAPTSPRRARQPSRPHLLLPQAWPRDRRDGVIEDAKVEEADEDEYRTPT